MCIFFHDWEKWIQYEKDVPSRMLSSKWMISGATDHMQKRRCKKCGKEQREKIGQTVY